MSVCLSICLFVGVCVPVWFLVHMSKYVPIEQDLTRYVSYWIWRGLHMYVLVAIDWKQNANSPGTSSHVDVTSRMKFQKVISKPKNNACRLPVNSWHQKELVCGCNQLEPPKLKKKQISSWLCHRWKPDLRPQTSVLGPRASDLRRQTSALRLAWRAVLLVCYLTD